MRRALRFENAAVAGVGMVRFGMLREYPIMHLARDAGLAALHDADMTLADVDEAFVGYIQLTSMLGIKAMKELGLTGLPVTHIENASATGLIAFREAAGGVVGPCRRGDGAVLDKFTDTREGGGAGRDEIDAPILPASYFALWAQRRMHERGTTPEQFAPSQRRTGTTARAAVVAPATRPRGDGRRGAGTHGGGAAHQHDVARPTTALRV